METTTQPQHSLPTLDTMASSDSYDFLKLEDLDATPSPSNLDTPPSSFEIENAGTPAPVIVQSKPAKKRKSWGQQLPEPSTALPPRKRAKTEDEKEQRRIERIKRNRAAAHNSRERKRQETDTLAVALARANAKIAAYERLHGPLPSSVVLPEVELRTDCETPVRILISKPFPGQSDSSRVLSVPPWLRDTVHKSEAIADVRFVGTVTHRFESFHRRYESGLSGGHL